MSGIGTPRKTPVSPTYKSKPSHEIDTQSPTERDRIMMSPPGQGFDTPQVQFVLKFFDHLSARNLDAAFSLLSDTLVYELWPASLAHGPRTKSEYKALLDTNPDRDVKFEILEMIESPGKVVAHVTPIIVSLTGGRYSKESCYIFTLGSNGDGSRTILHIKEIVDSKAATDIHREERERLLQQNA